MRRLWGWRIFAFTAITVFAVLLSLVSVPIKVREPTEIVVTGLVDNPLNLTRSYLLSLPTVSETARLDCIFGIPNATFSWTGIPLFHLLTLAQIRPEAVEVVFRASDGFSSSLLIRDALQPYVLLGLTANGTFLGDVPLSDYIAPNVQGGYRIIVPGKYGFKWVAGVTQIEVVDYDYNGTYETPLEAGGYFGYTEAEAIIPGYALPPINPSLQEFDYAFGNRTFQVKAFTNASITAFSLNYLQNEIELNATTPSGAPGFVNLIVPNSLLMGPYTVFVDASPVNAIEANVTGLSFVYVPLPEGSYIVRAFGTEFFGAIPEIIVDYSQAVLVGQTVTFNASRSASDVPIVSFEWDFGDGTKGSGAVVSHSYSEKGTYDVSLNVTDSDAVSVTKTLTVYISVSPQYISLAMRTFLIVDLSLVILLFIVLVLRKGPRPTRKVEAQDSRLAT